jgi:enoyl-CoA hydratase
MTEVRLERLGPVGVVTLDAPHRRNAFTVAMVEELIAVCDAIDADAAIGAVVLRAVGQSFCAGAHRALLDAAGRDPSAPENFTALGMAYRAFVRVGELQPPTIAAIRGHAVGAGVNLALSTDLRIVAHTARLLSGFLQIGLHPGGGHLALLGRLAGRETAAAMAIFGQGIDGQRAVDLGLAWESLPEPDVEPRALALAELAGQDPALARAMAHSLRVTLGPPPVAWPVALEAERGQQMWSLRRRAMPDA